MKITDSLQSLLYSLAYLFLRTYRNITYSVKAINSEFKERGGFKIENAYDDQLFILFFIREFKVHADQIYAIPKRGEAIFRLPFL